MVSLLQHEHNRCQGAAPPTNRSCCTKGIDQQSVRSVQKNAGYTARHLRKREEQVRPVGQYQRRCPISEQRVFKQVSPLLDGTKFPRKCDLEVVVRQERHSKKRKI